jgi:hypothetical protein
MPVSIEMGLFDSPVPAVLPESVRIMSLLSLDAHRSHQYCLPVTLRSWRKPSIPDNWWQPWEYLRSFFESGGYQLYRMGSWMGVPSMVPFDTSQDQGPNSVGVYGTRSYVPNCYLDVGGHLLPLGFVQYLADYRCTDPSGLLGPGWQHPAFDFAHFNSMSRQGHDVMIKVMSYQDEGIAEVEILKYLSSEPVKSEIDNPIVPVLEFLNHNGWVFAIQPRWSSCMEPEIRSVGQGLEFCVQVTKVNTFFRLLSLHSR